MALAALVSTALGCSSSSSGLACGGGTVQKGGECVAVEADASVDGAARAVDAGDAGTVVAPDGAIVAAPPPPRLRG